MQAFLISSLLLLIWVENTFTFQSPIKGFSFTNLALFFLLVSWIVSSAIRKSVFLSNDLYKYLGALLVLMVASIPNKYLTSDMNNISLASEIISLKGWFEPCLVYLLAFNIIESKKTCRKLVYSLLLIFMLTVVITLLVVTDTFLIGGIMRAHGGHWPKFAEPNQYGCYLVLMLPLLFSIFVFVQNIFSRTFFAGCCVLAISALIASGSRGGLLAFIITSTAFFIFLNKKHLVSKLVLVSSIIVLLAVLLLSLFFMPDKLVERTANRIIDNRQNAYINGDFSVDKYSSGRLELWSAALETFCQRPLLGHGQNAFPILLSQNFGIKGDSHNTYLKYLVDHGALGLLVFVLIFIKLARTASCYLRIATDKYGRMLTVAFLCGLIGFSITMIFVTIYVIWPYFFLYAAIVNRYISIDFPEH